MVRGSPNPLHFGLIKRLKQARKAAGVPPTSLARAAGLSPETVANVEKGHMPGVEVVERIARALQLPVCQLAYGQQVEVIGDEGGFIPDSPLRCSGMGGRLQQLRTQAGMDKTQLGAAAGVSRQTIANIESGANLPRLDVAESIARALNISPCALIYAEGPTAPWPAIKRPGAGPRRKTTAPG